MDVQHPRGTDVDSRSPPSKVSIPGHGNIPVTDDGYLTDLDEDVARQAMRSLSDAYGVTYTDDGDIVREEGGPSGDETVPDDPDEIAGESGTLPFNPEEHTNAEIEDRVADVDDEQALIALRNLEEDQRARKGALGAIDDRLDELEG